MTEFGRFIDGDRFCFECSLCASPAQVWDYLTQSELLSGWLGDGEIANEAGGRMVLRTGMGGPTIQGTVLTCEPPRVLSYTWNVTLFGQDELMGPEATVRFELELRGEETLLTLTHGPIAQEYKSRTGAGWHALLEILRANIAGEPSDFTAIANAVGPEYEKLANPS